MKIYHPTEYVQNYDVGDLFLEVISQWNFSTIPVCFDRIKNMIIPCALYRVIDGEKTELVTKLTKGMREELKSMGYELANEK